MKTIPKINYIIIEFINYNYNNNYINFNLLLVTVTKTKTKTKTTYKKQQKQKQHTKRILLIALRAQQTKKFLIKRIIIF
jgi:hypothetical protein